MDDHGDQPGPSGTRRGKPVYNQVGGMGLEGGVRAWCDRDLPKPKISR